MDGIRGEVSNKIRSAIKAKLMELGAYVDDELPDYIMVMVANKRSRQQMEDDLQLFLSDNTTAFTAWLHTVLSKLQQVTVNNAEFKKNIEKKRPSSEDLKKEKKKKIKKEKEKPEKVTEKVKPKEKTLDQVHTPTTPVKSHQIKTEPVDLITDEDSLLNESQMLRTSQPLKGVIEKRTSQSRAHEDDDDDDFINLKADVEADMWGETEEASAVKNLHVAEQSSSVVAPTDPKLSETQLPKALSEQSSHSRSMVAPSTLSDGIIAPHDVSSLKQTTDPVPSTKIIRISETIRQEQAALKPASQHSKDTQGLAKRVFQSHIVSLKNAQDKSEKSRSRTSLPVDTHSRRTEYRSDRKHGQQDLRLTLRNERQREREHGREREREKRRSREHNQTHKSKVAIASVVRAPLSHEDGPDQSLMSVVRVKPRPQIPAALQANRSLILKAVADAQKSVSKVVIRPELTTMKSNVHSKPKASKRSSKNKVQTYADQLNVRPETSPKKEHLMLKQSPHLPSREILRKMSFTVRGKKAEMSRDLSAADLCEGSDDGSIILDPSLNILIQVPASPADESLDPPDPVQTEKVRRWIKDVEEATKSQKTEVTDFEIDAGMDVDLYEEPETESKHLSDEEVEEFDDVLEGDTNSFKTSDIHSVVISEDQPLKKSTGTQFVVTLDGLDPRLLRSYSLEGDGRSDGSGKIQTTPVEQKSEEQDILLREELAKEEQLRQELLRQQAAVREQKTCRRPTIAVSPVLAPINPQVKRPVSPCSSLETRPLKVATTAAKSSNIERCKFWPSCKNGDKCEFHHPSVPCKLFPNCKFADRCLYIHPNCRFNSSCTRPDCPYTHSGLRPVQNTQSSGTSHAAGPTIKQTCKYYPNCSNLSCPYIHPTVCKFGTHCTKLKCQFIHSDKTLNSKHKWIRH